MDVKSLHQGSVCALGPVEARDVPISNAGVPSSQNIVEFVLNPASQSDITGGRRKETRDEYKRSETNVHGSYQLQNLRKLGLGPNP